MVLDVGFGGSFTTRTGYTPATGEVAAGRLTRRTGGEEHEIGAGVRLKGGEEGLTYHPARPLGAATVDHPIAVEAAYTPDPAQNAPATILSIGGGIWFRHRTATEMEYGFADVWATVEAPEPGREHTVALAYEPTPTGATLRAYLDGAPLPPLTSAGGRAPKLADTIGLGNDAHPSSHGHGMKALVSRAIATAFTGAYAPALLSAPAPAPNDPKPGPPLPTGDLEPSWRLPVSAAEDPASLVAKAAMLRPSRRQYDWQRLEQTAFLHFGVNTFTGQEWGHGDEDPDLFQPTGLDTDQWARELKAAGFGLAILTVKHHDGFVLYPSRYTGHTVAASSWRDGRGDVLRAFTDSAREHGLKVGVYISPADENSYARGVYANGSPRSPRLIPTPVEGDTRPPAGTRTYEATDYGAYMLNQLYEVLTEYGQVDEVWFDGSLGRIPPGKTEKYDFDSWYALIRDLAPHATIAVAGPDVRWVGNEGGLARENEWSPIPVRLTGEALIDYAVLPGSPDTGSRTAVAEAAATATHLQWWPAEVDVSIRPGWFYHPGQRPKTVDQLMDIYLTSVGRNAVLLLNIPPDQEGRLPAPDVARLREWRARLDREFPFNLATGAKPTGHPAVDGDQDTSWKVTGPLEITLPTAHEVDKVVLAEDIRHGQQVESAVVEVRQADGTWHQIAAAGTIGYKRILTLAEPVTGQEFRLRITAHRAQPYLTHFALYRTAPGRS
ncbi:alpha-L-fucosidase [Nonomuraea sp. NPDC050394]|uniref:alpha-L-fucosidase n=1 Tax=Nonomuraea sp. NPDC050394 TaxID=3364363 RepID=UPI00379B19CB